MSYTVGIDPGYHGAIFASEAPGKDFIIKDMPTLKDPLPGLDTRLDVGFLTSFFNMIIEDKSPDVRFWIEKQKYIPKNNKRQGGISTGTTMKNYGIICGILIGVKANIYIVDARTWQANVLNNIPRNLHGKNRAEKLVADYGLPFETRKKPTKKNPKGKLLDGRCDAFGIWLHGFCEGRFE